MIGSPWAPHAHDHAPDVPVPGRADACESDGDACGACKPAQSADPRYRRILWIALTIDLAVMAASLGVFGTGSALPDLAVAVAMAVPASTASRAVLRHARDDLRDAAAAAG